MDLLSTEELINLFFENGGSVSDTYLQNPDTVTPGRPSIVYLKNFYYGLTTRDAILRALSY